MKKSSLLFRPLVALASFMGAWLSGTDNVEAANNKTCQATWFRDEIVLKIEVNTKGNNSILTNNSGYNLRYKFIPDGKDGKDGRENRVTEGIINNGANVAVTYEAGGIAYFYLINDIDEPCVAKADTEVGLVQINTDGLVDNILYNDSVCTNYRNKWGNNEMMKNAVPYCYSATTNTNYSREQVQSWINMAEELYESVNSSNGNQDIVIDDSYKEIKDVTKTDKLVCDAFSTNNYETMHKYYHVASETENNCEVTCKEEIEVNFSDPVATQAGMCFQYLIEIKSKVVCNGKYKAPVPTRKQPCYLTPLCVSGSWAGDVGGPNDDFDNCIQKCDGGKYTQKCINSCYKKVYKNNGKTTKTSTNKDRVSDLAPLYNSSTSFYEVTKMASGCPGTRNAQALYEYMQRNPSGYYSGNRWVSTTSGVCGLAPYYFSSLEQTNRTVALSNGQLSYSNYFGGYYNYGDGFLRANYGSSYCNDVCYWKGSCPSGSPLTETLAQEQYEKDIKEYMAKKQRCEQKAATCTNESTDYKIVVDNKDNDNDTKDDQQSFESSQKMNSNKITGDFISMVILADGSCEDGEDDPWNYHNIITFPGAWINNKTGQIVHTMDKDREDFYTYVGNQYCTKLNSLPVNTAWYDWKVNKNGNQSALTDAEKDKIVNNLEMNIKGNISNYGYFGWNFDVECFYAVDKPSKSCSKDDPNWPDCDGTSDRTKQKTSVVDDYTFRSVALDNVFPSKTGEERKLGYNWTCEATNLENPDYLIQPVTVRNNVQALGDRVYEGNDYLDYHIRLTPDTIKKVRAYNKSYNSYAEPTSDSRKEVLTAGSNKTAGITVYKSRLLHSVLNGNELLKKGVIGCNNEDKGTCLKGEAAIDKTTSCYNEYMAQSAITKGVK